jgi:hypothetical protein
MLQDAKKADVTISEAKIVMRAVAATKLPALTTIDVALFTNLMKDTWPNETPDVEDTTGLRVAVEDAIASQGLELISEQVTFPSYGLLSIMASPLSVLA